MLGVSPEKNSMSIWNKKELLNADIISTINIINKKKLDNLAHSNQLQMGHEILVFFNMTFWGKSEITKKKQYWSDGLKGNNSKKTQHQTYFTTSTKHNEFGFKHRL